MHKAIFLIERVSEMRGDKQPVKLVVKEALSELSYWQPGMKRNMAGTVLFYNSDDFEILFTPEVNEIVRKDIGRLKLDDNQILIGGEQDKFKNRPLGKQLVGRGGKRKRVAGVS